MLEISDPEWVNELWLKEKSRNLMPEAQTQAMCQIGYTKRKGSEMQLSLAS